MDKIPSHELVIELQQLKIQILKVFTGEISVFFWDIKIGKIKENFEFQS
jgi:hypothetical protein